ncbi:DUF192 domain-containing protein [Candidatus Parcubacteria bacterium]|jgi:uncharacterized membrane protein (UPF0127 family)|nr:DUF192 domain-containing protein [Candidatus Parcubacteria bacterium]MBT3948556.1 DUF192 domain-containing protein [Candidatus Parcubacteria bacterium]
MKEKMSRGKLIFLVVFFVAAGFLFIFQRVYWPHTVVELKDQKLNVLVAKNIYQQQKGLGGRESLAPYDGMLFPYSLLGKPTMVMRDMEFSIDIVWFLDGEVVDFAPQVPTEPGRAEFEYIRYYPRTEANLVLELPGGWADEHNLRIGDRIVHSQ